MRLSDYLAQATQRHPDKVALLYGAQRHSFSDLLRASTGVAQWLLETRQEVGFRAAILSDEPFSYIASYFGIQMAGGVVVGLNTQPSEEGLVYTLNDCGTSALIASAKYGRYLAKVVAQVPSMRAVASAATDLSCPGLALAPLAQLLAGTDTPPAIYPFTGSCDYAQIIYTSGTTGKPKGVVLRHANLAANTASIVRYLGLTDQDRGMAVLPFFYSYGNSVLLTHMAVGASLVVNQSFLYPNVILQQMVEHDVTGFSGVPSTYALLLHRSNIANYSFPALRYLTQAGAAMSPQLARRLQDLFPQAKIYIMYGQTEASARLSYLPPEQLQHRPGSIGKAIPGVELRLLDKQGRTVPTGATGEIVARGENIMAGYWGKDQETRMTLRPEGLWTGDLAREDEEGYLYIVSRKSDIIKSGAHRISPKEIEEVLAEHPQVKEVAVVGVQDPILDERIRACLVVEDDGACDVKEILRYCRKRLPAYKVPQEVVFRKELPKTETGKIKKRALIS